MMWSSDCRETYFFQLLSSVIWALVMCSLAAV
uniref:Uncharacterized protein n=1 Tax=Arundo donax TaxID=35708 RepID=A0A0A9BNA1_ARUDO